MPASPKRKSSAEHGTSLKKPSNGDSATNMSDGDVADEILFSATPDSQINHAAAIAYWSSTPATVDGVLGGFPQVSRVDLQGSKNFLAKLRAQSKHFPKNAGKFKRVADCGAGIGRVTRGFLSNVAEMVDIVEPVQSFTNQIKDEAYVGTIYNLGLEQWTPEATYEVIWNQWCVGQLTDAQLIAYLEMLPKHLAVGGWIVVKENLSNHHLNQDVFDDTDSSVTRTDEKFRSLFDRAGLRLVATELQKGFPKDLYPVRAYALQPK